MCGRFGRKGDKQKIAAAFHVKGGLDEVDFGDDDLEAVQIAAHHAGGEPLMMVFENDGLWRQRLAEILGDAGAFAIMTSSRTRRNRKTPRPLHAGNAYRIEVPHGLAQDCVAG